MIIAVGSTFNALKTKEEIIEYLKLWGHEIVDCGATLEDKSEYTKYAYLVSKAVANKDAVRGILVSETGIEMSIVANKIKGIRAARCVDWRDAAFCRELLSSNVLCIGENVDVWQVVDSWLAVEFNRQNEETVMQISQIESIE